jgi:PucR family transcriptional regulator, purine catabolism regulatory protein
MGITIKELLELPGLGLTVVSGRAGVDRAIRWVHTSELQDPTPWLSGGELLLTTGMDLEQPADQEAYIRRLAAADLAGLGFGVGFGFDTIPAPILEVSNEVGFPVLEVPFPVPFIAISEAVSIRIAEDRLKDAQLSIEVHERLAHLVSDGAGPAELLEEVIALAGGWALLFDLRGDVLARSRARDVDLPDAAGIWSRLPSALLDATGPTSSAERGPNGSQVALAVVSGKRHEGVLVYGKQGRLEPRERMVVHHSVSVLGLLLASRRAVLDAERKIAADIIGEAFTGRLEGTDLKRRIEMIGFEPAAQVTALVIECPEIADAQALDEIAWSIESQISARARVARTAVMGDRIAALIAYDDPDEIGNALVDELERSHSAVKGATAGGFRVGVGQTVEVEHVRQSYLAAVFALRATRPEMALASPRELGSYGFLLGAQSRPVLEGFVRSVLGPLLDRDRARSSDLVASVRAFIHAGGRWEPGAEELGVHRHTLRYRVRQVEELLDRDLGSAEDRLEIWLALKALEVLEE